MAGSLDTVRLLLTSHQLCPHLSSPTTLASSRCTPACTPGYLTMYSTAQVSVVEVVSDPARNRSNRVTFRLSRPGVETQVKSQFPG